MRSRISWLRLLRPVLEHKRCVLLLSISILIPDAALASFLKTAYKILTLPGVFYYITLQPQPYWLRGLVFTLFGAGLLSFSIVQLQRSVLGPFLPGGDRSVAEVIYSFRTRSRGPRVVAIGGGTGMSTLLRGLKEYTANLAAIV